LNPDNSTTDTSSYDTTIEFFRSAEVLGWLSGNPVYDPDATYRLMYSGIGYDYTGIDMTNIYPFGSAAGMPLSLVAVGRNHFDGSGGVDESDLHCFTILAGTPPYQEYQDIDLEPEFVQDISFVDINGVLYAYVLMEDWSSCRIYLYQVSLVSNDLIFSQQGTCFGDYSSNEATAISAVLDNDYVYIYVAYQNEAVIRVFRQSIASMNTLPQSAINTFSAGSWGHISPGFSRAPFGIAVVKNPYVGVETEGLPLPPQHQHIVGITTNGNTGRIEMYRVYYSDYSANPSWILEETYSSPFWVDWYVNNNPPHDWQHAQTDWAWYVDETPYYPTLKHIDIDYLFQANPINHETEGPRIRIALSYPNISTSHIEMFKSNIYWNPAGTPPADPLNNAITDLSRWYSIDNYLYYSQDLNKVSRHWDPVTAVCGGVFSLNYDFYGVCAVHGHYQFWSFWSDW